MRLTRCAWICSLLVAAACTGVRREQRPARASDPPATLPAEVRAPPDAARPVAGKPEPRRPPPPPAAEPTPRRPPPPIPAGPVAQQLAAVAAGGEFALRSEQLVAQWSAAGVGIEAVETVLRFMEDHPALDYGTPGAIVHFVEQFDGEEYERRLVESVQRRPTAHTAWMLHRVINWTKQGPLRQSLIAALRDARVHPLADGRARERIEGFLERGAVSTDRPAR